MKGRMIQYQVDYSLLYKPPLGMFGKIVTSSTGDDPNTFDIKSAMLPIINTARLYALKNNIEETNTTDRINRLHALRILRDDNHRELSLAYRYLMKLRYVHQVMAIEEGLEPNNLINPKKITQIEKGLIKQAFSQIAMIQKKVSFDFLGKG